MATTRKPLLLRSLTQPGSIQLCFALEAKPWISSTGSPAPSSMKARRMPSETNVCTRAPILLSTATARQPTPLSSWRRKGYALRQVPHPPLSGAHMAASLVPHFANDPGVEKIAIGVKEFQCMGARPPHDHPHVYLDMGADGQILCPYCSTLYVHDARLTTDETEPKGCLVGPDAAAA